MPCAAVESPSLRHRRIIIIIIVIITIIYIFFLLLYACTVCARNAVFVVVYTYVSNWSLGSENNV